MPRKKTHDEFVIQLEERNASSANTIRLVDGQTYESTTDKLAFECQSGHTFYTTPKNILTRNVGCPECGRKRTAAKNTTSHTRFLEKLSARNQQYPPVFVAPTGRYTHIHTKMDFVCADDTHPSWSATPASILQGHGCPVCGTHKSADTHRYSHDEFVTLLDAHNIRYPHKRVLLHPSSVYTGFRSQLRMTCDYGHEWSTTPDNILNGKAGCPLCATSKSFSHMAIAWLQSLERTTGTAIQHRGNSPCEYTLPGTRYSVDGYAAETNTVYEFHGNYWHGNPRVHNHNDVNERTGKTFGELYTQTKQREQAILDLGYNLVVMWEDEFHESYYAQGLHEQLNNISSVTGIDVVVIPTNRQTERYEYENVRRMADSNNRRTVLIFEDELVANYDLIRRKLLHYSNTNTVRRIHARVCEVRACSNEEKRALLNANHLQGNDKSSVAYGAYYDNVLVAVMTFSSPRVALGQKKRTKELRWELVRFCTDIKYRIPGIASKLLKHFQRNHQWDEIYSYADKRWSVGNLYEVLRFDLVADNPPDYFYVVNGKRKHRWNYRKDIIKHKLPGYDSTKTEYENMVNHGYWRVWDCGTLKYSITNNEGTPDAC